MRHPSRTLLITSAVALAACSAIGCLGDDYVVVKPPPRPPSGISVSPNPATIQVGGTVVLIATGVGAAWGMPVTWSTSDALIATVDARSGVVTGVGAGKATITATGTGYAGSGTVTVTEW